MIYHGEHGRAGKSVKSRGSKLARELSVYILPSAYPERGLSGVRNGYDVLSGSRLLLGAEIGRRLRRRFEITV